MKGRIKYASAPKAIHKAIEEAQIIHDFLPPPEELVKKEDTIKITILLSKKCVEFFKNHAHKNDTSYQIMIKKVLDLYSSYYEGK